MKYFKRCFAIATAMIATVAATAQAPLAVRWEMGTNNAQPGFYSSKFVFKNTSDRPLGDNWMFFFNQFSRAFELPAACPVVMEEVSTTYYRIMPGSGYHTLQPGDSLVIDVMMKGTMVNYCYTPQGGHVVMDGNTAHPLPVTIEKDLLNERGQWGATDLYPTGDKVYDFNALVNSGLPNSNPFHILPTPKHVDIDESATPVRLPSLVSFKAPPFMQARKMNFARVKNFLSHELQLHGIHVMDDCPFVIEARIDKSLNDNPEHYTLQVTDSCIVIAGATDLAILDGAKTLVAALDHTRRNTLPQAIVDDYPDFAYRGFMADVARNFYGLDDLKKLIDLLAHYKISKLQFHFADDEAWRLEIPGLPELTQVASRRGCTLNELEDGFLAQIFDGNGDPNDLSTSANGFLTREQFVDLLKYAHARGITIIPEIDTPGHSRAAIVAMKYRYNKLVKAGDKNAARFMLWDPADEGKYKSTQAYANNVLNPAQEGTYRFLQKVVSELEKMYRSAGLRLGIVHLGGDEVASGAWDNSPAVKALMTREKYTSTHQVMEHYIDRISLMLDKRGIKIEGWQEVALGHDEKFNKRVAPRFAGVNAWSTIGSRIEVPYKVANAGYPTILSNVDNFYMDMGYNWHQYEQGLHWGGCVSEFDSWKAQPWNLYGDNATDKTPLQQRQNIIGVQAQLWGETLRNFKQVEYLLLPKILGLVERGWNATAAWMGDEQAMRDERAAYNLNIAAYELPAMAKRGYNFRVPQPGIKIIAGKIHANAQYPNTQVRFTTDGSEPTASSPLWTAPVTLPAGCTVVKARAFFMGKESVTSNLWTH